MDSNYPTAADWAQSSADNANAMAKNMAKNIKDMMVLLTKLMERVERLERRIDGRRWGSNKSPYNLNEQHKR